MNLDEARKYLEFLLNGLRAFLPEIFELKASPTDYWEGWRQDDFVPLVLNLTQTKTAPEAKAVLEEWLSAPEITRNVPLSIIEAAKETKEIAEAPTPEAQSQASEVLLAKSSNLAAELEAAGQVVPKPSAAAPEAPAPTRPAAAVVAPTPPVALVEEGAVVLRPIRLAPSPKAEVKSMAKEATEKRAAFREQIREWIKESFPQTPEEKAQALSERFAQRLVTLGEEKPTVAATLKAVAKSDQVAPEARKKAAQLLDKAVTLAEEDRKIIEAAVSEKIPKEAVEQAFAQDFYEYESITRPVQKSVVVRTENFIEKAEASIAQKVGVDFAEAIIPTAAAIPTAKAIEETFYIKPAGRLPAGLGEKEQESLISHTDQVRADAQKYVEELAQKISKTLPEPLARATSPKEAAEISRRTAENFVERLLNPEKPSITDYARPENEAALKRIFPDGASRQEFLVSANEALIAETAESQILANTVDKQIVDVMYRPLKIEALKAPQPETFPAEAFSLRETAYLKTEIARPTLPAYGLLLSEQGVVPAEVETAKIVGVAVTRATPKAKDLGERATFSSFKFVRELGAEQLAKTQPHEATALKLISMGIGSKDIASLAKQAEKLGLKPTVESLKNLEQVLRAIEETQPSLAKFAQGMEVELKLMTEPSQLKTSQFLLVPSQQSYLFAPSTPDRARGPIFSYLQGLFEKPASKFLGRLTAPAKEKIAKLVGKKKFAKLARIVGKKGLRKALGGFLGKIAAKIGLKALATKVGAALGSLIPIPGIGTAVGAIVGFLSSFALDAVSWLKRKIQKNKEVFVGALLLGGGLLIGGPVGLAMIVGGGAIGLGAAAIQAGGVQGAASAVGGIFATAITGFFTFVVGIVATPIIVSFIIIVFLIAVIIFIINSGAYLVPPGIPEFSGIIESPYIGVAKTATPDCLNRAGCPGLPGAITYEIEITAKEGTLTNISITNSYEVLGEGSSSDLPPIPDIPTPTIISPVEPFTFSYQVTFGSALDNSIILDTLTVTADAPDQVGATASDVASVIIGNPPASSCPIIGGGVNVGSYDGVNELGHGSNPYWGGSCGTIGPDLYEIPEFTGCKGPTDAVDPDRNNICYGVGPSCSFYGYAADIWGAPDTPVFLPSIFDEIIDWTYKGRVIIAETAWGWGYYFSGGGYELYLGHLNLTTPPATAPSGTVIGSLFPGLTNPHVHIELQINGQWVKPDFLCGGPGP